MILRLDHQLVLVFLVEFSNRGIIVFSFVNESTDASRIDDTRLIVVVVQVELIPYIAIFLNEL